jgi:methylated-DNA-[protein]-cysteine S-methyltransferase
MTVGRVPWDVPVELVTAPDVPPESTVHPVALGIELPGIESVIAETVTLGGRIVLSAIRPAQRPATRLLRELLEELAGQSLAVDGRVPVLAQGSPFARTVHAALLTVAAGERCTYAGLATRAGRPRAVRAAAHVMATNRVPLVLPCHRIVPSSGGMGRYGWGDGVKSALLEAEER